MGFAGNRNAYREACAARGKTAMTPVKLGNPDIVLRGPEDMPECGNLTAAASQQNGYPARSLWKPSQAELAALMKEVLSEEAPFSK